MIAADPQADVRPTRGPRSSRGGGPSTWVPVGAARGLVITGGVMPDKRGVHGYGVATMLREFSGEELELVPIRLNDFWLLKIAGGLDAVKGHFASCEIIASIRAALKKP